MTNRKLVSFAAGTAALLLALASAAYACTSFKGQFRVTGNGGGTVTVVGSGSGMSYKSISSAFTRVTSGGTLTYRVAPDPANAANKLPSGRTYYLRWDDYTGTTDGSFSPNHYTLKWDCMEGAYGIRLGSGVTVSSTGYGGPWSRTIPSTSARTPFRNGVPYNEAAACISDARAAYGNQAPVAII